LKRKNVSQDGYGLRTTRNTTNKKAKAKEQESKSNVQQYKAKRGTAPARQDFHGLPTARKLVATKRGPSTAWEHLQAH